MRRVLSAYAAYYNQTRTHWRYRKMRRCVEPSNALVALSPFQSWPGCITNTSGYDFRKGHLLRYRLQARKALRRFLPYPDDAPNVSARVPSNVLVVPVSSQRRALLGDGRDREEPRDSRAMVRVGWAMASEGRSRRISLRPAGQGYPGTGQPSSIPCACRQVLGNDRKRCLIRRPGARPTRGCVGDCGWWISGRCLEAARR